MGYVADLVRDGGGSSLAILLVGLVASIWSMIQTYKGARGMRLPSIFWWIGPVVVTVVAFIGAGVGLGEAAALAERSPLERLQRIVDGGWSGMTAIVGVAAVTNVVLAAEIALGTGLTAFLGAREEEDRQVGRAAATLGAGATGAGVIGAWLTTFEAPTFAMAIPVSLLVGGLGCALASARPVGEGEEGDARLADRVAGGGAVIFAVVFAAVGAVVFGLRATFESIKTASLGNRADIAKWGFELAASVGYAGGAALLAALVVAAVAVVPVGRRLFNPTVKSEAIAGLAAIVVMVGALAYGGAQLQSFVPHFNRVVYGAEEAPDATSPEDLLKRRDDM